MRWFTKSLKHQDIIQSITLESFDNAVAPAFVAITADMPRHGRGAGGCGIQVGSRNAPMC